MFGIRTIKFVIQTKVHTVFFFQNKSFVYRCKLIDQRYGKSVFDTQENLERIQFSDDNFYANAHNIYTCKIWFVTKVIFFSSAYHMRNISDSCFER